MLALVRYSVISVTILWFYLSYLTHLLNARQMLTYYPTLILNVFAMMLENHFYYWNAKGVTKFLYFSRKNYFLSLLVRIRIKTYLPLKPVITESWITEKREVSSAKSLVLEETPSDKSLIYFKNNNSPRMRNSCINISPWRRLPI